MHGAIKRSRSLKMYPSVRAQFAVSAVPRVHPRSGVTARQHRSGMLQVQYLVRYNGSVVDVLLPVTMCNVVAPNLFEDQL